MRRKYDLNLKKKVLSKIPHTLFDFNLSPCICDVTLTGGHNLQANHFRARAEELHAFRILIFPLVGGEEEQQLQQAKELAPEPAVSMHVGIKPQT